MIPGDRYQQLAYIIRETVRCELSDTGKIALMFSGGVDSSLLAVIARKFSDVTLYTAGTEGSHDLEWAGECAGVLDLPYVPIVIGREEIAESMERTVKVHGIADPKWMTTFVGFDLVLRNVAEDTAMCGQGADEMFGGYAKYRNASNPMGMMREDMHELQGKEFPMYRKVASHYGKELLAPFLDGRIQAFTDRHPELLDTVAAENKQALRKAAMVIGVPGMMAEKPKKAMQYGSGISKEVKRLLRKNGNIRDI